MKKQGEFALSKLSVKRNGFWDTDLVTVPNPVSKQEAERLVQEGITSGCASKAYLTARKYLRRKLTKAELKEVAAAARRCISR